MDVSVIIVNYHSEELIKACVKTVNEKTTGLEFEIIIVDNAGGQEALDQLQTIESEHIRIISSDSNLGFGKANNLGASYAEGKYLFLLNPDTELINNAVKILYDYSEEHPDTGIAGGNLYSKDGNPVPSFCMEYDTLKNERKDSSWSEIILSKVREKTNSKRKVKKQFNDTNVPMEVAYIFGADMFMKKSVFDSANGFDPDFFMYAEEEELTRRIAAMGYNVICVPQAKIIHLEGATTSEKPGFSAKQFAMRMNGKMTYFDKCYPPDGADQFFKYRSRKYQRMLLWRKLTGRKTANSVAAKSVEILRQVYTDYCKERN